MVFFRHDNSAKRYGQYRPYFHPLVVEKMKAQLTLDWPLVRVLDIACGTGQSTQALLSLADSVIGFDISDAMLLENMAHPKIHLLKSPAEQLPFSNKSFVLATVGLAYHWFNRDKFLPEIARVLQDGGYFVIYNNGFSGIMLDNPRFEEFSKGIYPEKYPTPPRDYRPTTEEHLFTNGLVSLHRETYKNEVTFSIDALANYLMTQSNIIAALQAGESPEMIYQWLIATLEPYFRQKEEQFQFGGWIEYLKRSNE